jgi:flagellar hook-associated protein 3 FlgL
MRITNLMLSNNMLNNISKNLVRMDKYQNQLATGKKIDKPSDDPVVAARALKLRTDVGEIKQFKENANDASSWLEITDDALAKMDEVMQRTRQLAVQAANGTNTPGETQKIAAEMKELKEQLIQLSNSTYAGRYLFSGFQTDKPLIDTATGNFNIDVLNTENIKYEIGVGDSMDINVLGGDLFNLGGTATTGTKGLMIQNFESLLSDLAAGNSPGISASLAKIDDNMNNLARVRADIGARHNRLTLTSNRLDSDIVNFTKLMSQNEDVDMSETIMNLQNEENVYRASLSGGARVIQPSLVDFIK